MLPSEQLRHVPHEPGVYLYRDLHGRMLYIGKAKDLRRRVLSYFSAARHPRRIARLVREIGSVEVITTLTEEEALTHEAHLIREHQPPYNIALKFERPYTYLKLSTEEDFPRLDVAHEVGPDGGTYFGPYRSSAAMLLLKETVDRHFQLRKRPAPIGDRVRKPCWNYQLGLCHAPCAGAIGREDYKHLVEEALHFLRGEHAPLLERLSAKMHEAASRMEYEWAAQVRDQIRALERLFARQQAPLPEPRDQDVVAAAFDGGAAALTLLVFRQSRLMGMRRFDLEELEEADLGEALESLLKQYYASGAELPAELLVDRALEDRRALERWLGQLAGRRVRIRQPRVGREHRLLEMARKNVELSLKARLAEEGPERVLERLRRSLELRSRPERIECIDGSHFHGQDIVASLVVCTRGRMDRSQYRRYRITGLEGADDFATVAQVVARRLDRLQAEDQELPDLILIDGGAQQLAAALGEVRRRGLERSLDVAAIAKARAGAADPLQRVDRIFLADRGDPVDLRGEPSALLLLQRVRDEAHRFALAYQRQIRSRRTVGSALDSIPGVGRIRKRELLRALGSVTRVAAATPEELAQVRGVDRKTAARIHQHFRRQPRPEPVSPAKEGDGRERPRAT